MLYIHRVQEEEITHELAKAIRLQNCVILMSLGIALFNDRDEKRPQNHLKELLRRMIQWCIEKELIPQTYTDRFELVRFLRKLVEAVATPQQIEVYISYASQDHKMRNTLQQHLNLIKSQGLKITWSEG